MTEHGPAQVSTDPPKTEKGSEWIPILLSGLGAIAFLVIVLIIVFLTNDVQFH